MSIQHSSWICWSFHIPPGFQTKTLCINLPLENLSDGRAGDWTWGIYAYRAYPLWVILMESTPNTQRNYTQNPTDSVSWVSVKKHMLCKRKVNLTIAYDTTFYRIRALWVPLSQYCQPALTQQVLFKLWSFPSPSSREPLSGHAGDWTCNLLFEPGTFSRHFPLSLSNGPSPKVPQPWPHNGDHQHWSISI